MPKQLCCTPSRLAQKSSESLHKVCVGEPVGVLDGANVGVKEVGDPVGVAVGPEVGNEEGEAVGFDVGDTVGPV